MSLSAQTPVQPIAYRGLPQPPPPCPPLLSLHTLTYSPTLSHTHSQEETSLCHPPPPPSEPKTSPTKAHRKLGDEMLMLDGDISEWPCAKRQHCASRASLPQAARPHHHVLCVGGRHGEARCLGADEKQGPSGWLGRAPVLLGLSTWSDLGR